jgi:ABC-2 type transport system permease protein
MIAPDAARVRAVVRKELRDYRRKRAIVVSMAVLPLLFLAEPVVAIFLVPSSGTDLDNYVVLPLLYLLLIPVLTPGTLAAYAVAGEREQGTLEPLLTTPIRKQEFILGKAAAVMIPTLALSYTVFSLFLIAVALFAKPAIASAVFHQGPVLLALFLFAPLLAGWAIVVGMAVSVRASEVRVAQQLGTLASFPIIGVVALLAVGVIHPTFGVAVLFAVVLLAIDVRALRIVARMFDRERLVTGTKAARS